MTGIPFIKWCGIMYKQIPGLWNPSLKNWELPVTGPDLNSLLIQKLSILFTTPLKDCMTMV